MKTVISVSMEHELAEEAHDEAKRQRMPLSMFCREAIRVAIEQAKADRAAEAKRVTRK